MSTLPPTVLIIDDDEGVTSAIASRLESTGLNCITAGTGSQGLAVFDAEPVNLVISDLNMPCGDGVELAKSIRQRSNVPIIFVTGFRDAYREQTRAISGVSVLHKPFSSSDLVDLVEAELALAGYTFSETSTEGAYQ